jgi:hypothetical protein
MAFFLPQNNDERLEWAINFKEKFPATGAQFNFGADEIAKAVTACDTIIFSIALAREARRFSRRCTAFRNTMVKSDETSMPVLPQMTMPALPDAFSPPNAAGYLHKIVRELKSKAKYNAGVGLNLRIVPPKKRALTADSQPRAKLKSLLNSVVRIDWKKLGADGVIIESKRGDEENWTEIGRDTSSPFIDTRKPLVEGQPEIRYYRLIYMIADEPFGQYSQIYEAITNPNG